MAVEHHSALGPSADRGPAASSATLVGPAIETRDLHKRFGSYEVLNGVNLAIPEGALAVIMGPSGTGKSVMLKHIIGSLPLDRGDVLVFGRSLGAMSRRELIDLRRDIGVMWQDGALFSAMTVYDNVAFPLRQHTDLAEREVRELVDHHLRQVGLLAAAGRYPSELSGGMKKRAGLARALVLNPKLLLCDEPDSGLDPVRTALLAAILKELHAEAGTTMLIVTHNILLSRAVAEYVAVLWKGQIVVSGPADEVWATEDPFVRQFLAAETAGPLGMD